MYPLDPLSSFALCGAGALVGAVLMRPSAANDAPTVEALRVGRSAFGAIGIGLSQLLLQEPPLPLWGQAAMSLGGVAGVLMIGWALSALGGRVAPRAPLLAALAGLLLALFAAWPFGTPGMTWFCTLGLAGSSAVMAWMGRRVLLRPRDLHERLLGAAVLLMLLTCLLRASLLFAWDGPYERHLVHVPPALLTPFMVSYGVLPVVFATLLLNVVNARLQARLHQRAMTDHLTGALSRHALAEGAAELVAGCRRARVSLAVLMLDLDHFKQINDRHGHAGGDAVLRHAADLLRSHLRPDALLARFGGEEFVVLVRVDGLHAARGIAERLRQALAASPWDVVLQPGAAVTASLGVTLLRDDETLERALERADEALYRAKGGGRNQVQVALEAA